MDEVRDGDGRQLDGLHGAVAAAQRRQRGRQLGGLRGRPPPALRAAPDEGLDGRGEEDGEGEALVFQRGEVGREERRVLRVAEGEDRGAEEGGWARVGGGAGEVVGAFFVGGRAVFVAAAAGAVAGGEVVDCGGYGARAKPWCSGGVAGDAEKFGAQTVLDGVEQRDQNSNRLLRVRPLFPADFILWAPAMHQKHPCEAANIAYHTCKVITSLPEAVVAGVVAEDEHQTHDDAQRRDDETGERDGDVIELQVDD